MYDLQNLVYVGYIAHVSNSELYTCHTLKCNIGLGKSLFENKQLEFL